MHSNDQVPDIISDLADATGGVITECVNNLGDGSGFATMSLPLPEDHWLYETTPDGFTPRPHYPMRAGAGSTARNFLADMIVNHGGKYGVKCATINGREDDFDPDALVRNIEIGLFGVFTADGLNGMGDGHLFDPVDTTPTLGKVLLEALSLALHDGLVTLGDISWAMTEQGIRQAVERHNERLQAKEEEYQALRKRKGWDQLDAQADDAPTPPPEN